MKRILGVLLVAALAAVSVPSFAYQADETQNIIPTGGHGGGQGNGNGNGHSGRRK